MDLKRECQQNKVEKYYHIEEKKKEKKYLYKKFSLPKLMKIKIKNYNYPKKKIYNFLLIKNKFNKLYYPRIGIIIKKKYIKYSVQRNKIKRIIYETFRLQQYKIKNYDYILIIKKNILHIKKKFSFFIQKVWKKYYK